MMNAFRSMMLWLAGMTLLIGSGCASNQVLPLVFQPRAETDTSLLTLNMTVTDNRANTVILGPEAAVVFHNFSGKMVLVPDIAAKPDSTAYSEVHDPEGLFYEAFKRRFSEGTIDLVSETETATHLSVSINSFFLDLDRYQWKARIAIDVTLSRNGSTVVESIAGEGERIKIWGTRQAKVLFSQLFENMINTPDFYGMDHKLRMLESRPPVLEK